MSYHQIKPSYILHSTIHLIILLINHRRHNLISNHPNSISNHRNLISNHPNSINHHRHNLISNHPNSINHHNLISNHRNSISHLIFRFRLHNRPSFSSSLEKSRRFCHQQLINLISIEMTNQCIYQNQISNLYRKISRV